MSTSVGRQIDQQISMFLLTRIYHRVARQARTGFESFNVWNYITHQVEDHVMDQVEHQVDVEVIHKIEQSFRRSGLGQRPT